MKATVDCVGGWSISLASLTGQYLSGHATDRESLGSGEGLAGGSRVGCGWGGGTQGKFGSGRITFIRPGLGRCVPPTLLTLPDTAPISRSPCVLHSRF